MVLQSTETPVVPSLPSIEEPVQSHKSEQDLTEIDTAFSELVLGLAADHSATVVDTRLENKSNIASSVAMETAEHRKPESSLNHFLPPLLALVALKDSFLDFIKALKEKKMDNHHDCFQTKPNMDRICSDGPCQPETWPNCWNISDDSGLSHCLGDSCYDDDRLGWTGSLLDFGKPCHNCGASIKGGKPVSELCHERRDMQNVRCCCDFLDDYSTDTGIDWQHPVFSELSALGFMTGPGYPIFVTT